MLLPAGPGVCDRCAKDHPRDMPHNQQSVFWQYWFHANYGRFPTWADAMAHCSPEVQALWVKELSKRGIKVELPESERTVQAVKTQKRPEQPPWKATL